jgi:type IV pilus assembly protein PilO
MKMKKPMPKGAVPALIVVGGLLALFAGWKVVVSPVKKHIAAIVAETQSTQQQIADRIAQSHTATTATAAPQIHVADIYRIAKAMPSITDMPDILLELDQTALAAGVSLQSISPGTPAVGTAGYSTIPLSLNASGDFYQITDLLYRLRNLVAVRNGALDASGRLFSVDSVSLSPTGARQLNASVNLETYVYGAVSATGATQAPATTSTTTTTSTDTTSTTTTTPSSTGTTAAGGQP